MPTYLQLFTLPYCFISPYLTIPSSPYHIDHQSKMTCPTLFDQLTIKQDLLLYLLFSHCWSQVDMLTPSSFEIPQCLYYFIYQSGLKLFIQLCFFIIQYIPISLRIETTLHSWVCPWCTYMLNAIYWNIKNI